MLTIFLAAIGLGLAVAAPVGPTGTTAIRHGLAGGWQQTFWIGQGAALTDLLYILATYAGVMPFLARLTWLPLVLYAAGVVIIGRMAWGSLRDVLGGARVLAVEAADRAQGIAGPDPWHRALRIGLAVTLVNPATITLWLTLGGSFISANLVGRSPLQAILLLSGIWVGAALWFAVLALIVGIARAAIGRIPGLFRAVDAASSLVLLGFALGFAWKLGAGLLAIWPG